MAENINVVARVRPFSEWIGTEKQGSSCVTIDPRTSTIFIKTTQQQEKKFVVNKAFDQDTEQKSLYADVGQRIVHGFVEGINGTIFAYGQTGSGKTFTMLGPEAEDRPFFDHRNRGIIPRAIEEIFNMLNAAVENNPNTFSYSMRCSFLELYNERLYDLLQDNNEAIKIQAGIDRQICVIGAAEVEVSSSSQCMDLLWRGWNQRKVAETSMNRESSRSHAVFMLYLETETIEDFVINRRSSRLNLVDLAGSERQGHTNNTGDRLKEASNINKSLTFLARVIRTLATSKKPEHVPYRDSQLTYLLKDSLGGNARTAVIVNIHPNHRFFGETISTLHFAENCKKIKNIAKVNEAVSCDDVAAWKAEIERLRLENRMLRDQLSSANQLQDDILPQSQYDDGIQEVLTAEQRKERRQTKFIFNVASSASTENSDDLAQKLADAQGMYEAEERQRLECEVKNDQLQQIVEAQDARIKQLQADLASTQMRCDHEKEFKNLDQKYQDALNVERKKSQQLIAEKDRRIAWLESWNYEDMVKELQSRKALISELEEENDSLKQSHQHDMEESKARVQQLEAKYATLKEEKEVIQAQRDDYLNQLNEGAGHNNHAQKIQHLEKMKKELKAANNENAKLRSILKAHRIPEKEISTFQRSS